MNGSSDSDPFDNLALTDEQLKERRAVVSRKIQRRRQQFVMVPMTWCEGLVGASGKTILLAINLLYLGWKAKGPIKLPNGMLHEYGIDRFAKWRGLADLERRGLVAIGRRPRRSPLITLLRI
jgi:hypothetical protein